MDPVPEIRREKVFLQPGMSTEEIKKTYGPSSDQAYKAGVKGVFIKNYMKKQIIIDRKDFTKPFAGCPAACRDGFHLSVIDKLSPIANVPSWPRLVCL
jgi:hypothetical protein